MRRPLCFAAITLIPLLAGIVLVLRSSRAMPLQVGTPTLEDSAPARPAPFAGAVPIRRTAPEPSPRRDFDAILVDLVEVGVRINDALEREQHAAAQACEARVVALRAELEKDVPDAAERALLILSAIPSEDVSRPTLVRRGLCRNLVHAGLEAYQRTGASGGDRRALDALVSGILAALASDGQLARELGSLLRDQPYLGLAHEPAVLELITQAAEQPFLGSLASALLQTLWRNLERDGARTSAEIASLALLFKDDANPSRRLAALRALLTAQAGRFRELVVHDVLQRRDRGLARAVTAAAAEDLDVRSALDIVERLVDVAGHDVVPALLTLGQRDAAALHRRYEEKLADNLAPTLRAELVSGAGFAGTKGLDLAKLAFQLDPDHDVRSRAMFVLTARAGAALGEATIGAMLDDADVSGNPLRLGQIVLALENLIDSCAPDVVERLGRRLAGHELLPGDRQTLEKLLARAVPGGGR